MKGPASVLLLVTACGRLEFEQLGPALGPACGPAYQPAPELGTGSRYRTVFATPASWHAAEADCESDGGHLVVIESELENSWVVAQAPSMVGPGELWLGATDHAQEGTFRWVTGASLTYAAWSESEPNDSGGEDCAHTYGEGTWNDKSCDYLLGYICECDRAVLPPPDELVCDTQTDPANCGECGTSCPSGVCSDQRCQ